MHLFLSPHLDDAAYSCGGTIHQLTMRGAYVEILTVMAGDPPAPPPDTPIVRDLHARWQAGQTPIATRRAEDTAAAALLGATTDHMHLPDCVYRTGEDGTPLYPTEESLWEHIHPKDPAITHLSGFRLPPDVTHIYAPLGVGAHVDHLIVHDMGIAIAQLIAAAGASVRLAFYVEYPYNENPAAVNAALTRLPKGVTLAHAPVPLTHANITAKIGSIRAYRSQVSTFWEDEAALEKRVRAALVRGSSNPAEHYFELQRGE